MGVDAHTTASCDVRSGDVLHLPAGTGGSMTVLRVCYKSGVPFDEGYYVSKHLPLVANVYGPLGLRNVEVVKVSGSASGSAPPYAVIFSAYFDSSAAMQSAMQSPRAADVRADIPNYYGGAPDVMIGEVVAVPS